MMLNAIALGEFRAPVDFWVPTVRNLVSEERLLWPGRRVAALGYHSPGDGGGGIFRFDPNPQTVDGGTILARRSGTGVWVREVRTAAINPEMFGAGEQSSDMSDALQTLFDSAAGTNAYAVLTAGRSYPVKRALFVRRSGTHILGNQARIVLAANEIKGAVITLCNASDVQIENLGIDVAGRFQNGLVVIGNTREFAETTALGPAMPVHNIVIQNIEISNARFHINRREAVALDVPLDAAAVGDEVTGVDSLDRTVMGTIVAIESGGTLLTVDWRINRVQPGTRLTLSKSGGRALIMERRNVPVQEPLSKQEFASWFGKFGGKGLSIQRACSQIRAEKIAIADCDIGLSLEAHPPAPANGLTDVLVTEISIKRARRTPVWIHSSAGQSTDAMRAQVRGLEILDPCLGGDRMGVISLDRAANLDISDVRIEFSQPPAYPIFSTVLRGLFTNCTFADLRHAGPAEGGIAFEPHARWGNAPGDFSVDRGGNSAELTLTQAFGMAHLLWWHSAGRQPVQSSFHFLVAEQLDKAQMVLPASRSPTIQFSVKMS